MDQAIQIAGALLILVAYAGLQAGRVRADSYPYLALNLVGASVLAALAWSVRQWGFLLLEGAWALVSARSLYLIARGRCAADIDRSDRQSPAKTPGASGGPPERRDL